MSFYQILTRKRIIEIYTSAAGLLFVSSISNFVGIFFKIWLRDSNTFGLRLLCAQTHFRSYFEIISKCVMIATMGGVWYNCLNQWFRNDRRVIIYQNFGEMLEDGIEVPGLTIGITLIIIPLVSVMFKKLKIGDQGFEFDPEEDKE